MNEQAQVLVNDILASKAATNKVGIHIYYWEITYILVGNALDLQHGTAGSQLHS